MSDSKTRPEYTPEAHRLAAALTAFLDLPRIVHDLDVTLQRLGSAFERPDTRHEALGAAAEEGLWDAAQVARFLRVSRSWVYQRAESGLLPARDVGGLLRFDVDAIRAYAATDPTDRHQPGKPPTKPPPRSRRTTSKAPEVVPSHHPTSKIGEVESTPTLSASHRSSHPSPSPRTKTLFDVHDVAEHLGVSAATVYKLCATGALTHVRVANIIRVDPLHLEEFIAGGQRGASSSVRTRPHRRPAK